MAHPSLQAPWRIDYVRAIDGPSHTGCFICDAANASTPDQKRDRLVLWTTEHSVVLLNRYPYTNGHLLICPKAHKPDFCEMTEPELLDLQVQTTKGMSLVQRAMSPHGFNIGINLGRCAGAGVPGHLHQHLVPRWPGDNNYMTVIGEVRVLPQSLTQLYDELLAAIQNT